MSESDAPGMPKPRPTGKAIRYSAARGTFRVGAPIAVSAAAPETTVSVVIPTYHRPDLMARAVHSALDQLLPETYGLEVIISVSDASATADRAAAQQLADKDPRVRVVVADRLGPGPARNAGIAVASGSFIALLDDDCQAQPGWLRAGIEALREVDLVQGKTYPGDGISRPTDKTIWVLKFSGLWESCNLLFRRSVIDRFGGFDESWNPSGRRGDHYGEDTEWGWRVVRSGATYAFVPEALVHHAVFRRTLREWFRYNAKTRYFPLIVRDAPEVRETFFYKHFFFQRRHVAFAVGELLLVVAGVGKVFGRDRAARSLALLSVAAFTGRHARRVACEVGEDVTRAAALIYGTARYRRIVL